MVDVARLKLELAGLATDAQRCRKEVREATHNGDVSYRYYACQLAEGHVGACDVAGRNLLMWPGYEVMAALLDEVEEHREEAMIRRAVLTIPEVYASVVSQAVAEELEMAKEWARSHAEESRSLRAEVAELKKRLGE